MSAAAQKPGPKKPAARKRDAARRVLMIDWQPAHHDFFRLACEDWIHPKQVKVTVATGRSTWEAGFHNTEGVLYRLKTKLRHYPDGKIGIVEEGMAIRFFLKVYRERRTPPPRKVAM